MKTCKISIIVPIYNVEKYLGVCIESILSQSYENLEILLVDDGSPDQCGMICEEYAKKDSRIYVIHKKNGGLSDARNAGLDVATGEYIVFVDSDDAIHPKMIEILYKQIKDENVDMSVCSHIEVNENFKGYEKISNEEEVLYLTQIFDGKECNRIIHSDLLGIDMNVMWNKMFPKKIFETLRFPKGKIHEDEFVNYLIFYQIQKCAYINQPLYFYRQRSGSIMSEEKKNILLSDKIEMYESRISFFKEHGEIELYYLAIINFLISLMRIYVLTREYYPKKKEYLDKIKSLHRELYYNNIYRNKNIPMKVKFKNRLFLMNKTIYWILIKINSFKRECLKKNV